MFACFVRGSAHVLQLILGCRVLRHWNTLHQRVVVAILEFLLYFSIVDY